MKRSTLNLTIVLLSLLIGIESQAQLLTNFPGWNSGTGFNNAVRAIAEQSDGKLIVGGQFSTYKGVTVNGLCRLLQNGDLDTTFINSASGITGVGLGIVLSIKVLPDDRILIGGDFGSIQGNNRKDIARLHKDGTLDQSFNPGWAAAPSGDPTSQVYAIEILPNGNYAFGGIHVNGSNNIGICSPAGVIQPQTTLGGSGNAITDMKVYPGNRLLISGTFGSGKQFIDRIILSSWTSDPTFEPYYLSFVANGFNSRINTMLVLPDGKIMVGGDFTFFAQSTPGSVAVGRLARLDSNGRLDAGFVSGNGFNGRVWQILQAPTGLNSNNFVVCGEFTSYQGTTTNRLAVITPTAALANSGTFANNIVYTVHKTQTENFMVTGGTFGAFNGSTQNGISLLTANTCLKPVFLNYPVDQSATLGSTRTFSASVLPQTLAQYTWFRNGSQLPGVLLPPSATASLTIPSVTTADTGLYRVTASGTCGNTLGPNFRLSLITPPVLGFMPADTTYCESTTANLTATASGAQLSYTWFRGTTLVSSGAQLSISFFNAADTGLYKVLVSNPAGSDSAIVRLKLPNPTVIVQQPASLNFCLGDTLNFQVVATGFNLSYQWRRNSSTIAGETGTSLSIVAAPPYSSGNNINVIISNSCVGGTIISSPALITQRSTPATPVISGPATVCSAFPDTVIYTTTANAAQYQWTFPSGWSGNSSINPLATVPGAASGTITLRVRDTACFSSPATRTVSSTNTTARLDSGLLRYWSFNQQDSLRDVAAGATGTLTGSFSPFPNNINSNSNTVRFSFTPPITAAAPISVVLRFSVFSATTGNFVTLIGSNETSLPAGHPVLIINTARGLQAWSNAGAALGSSTLLQLNVMNTVVLNRNGSSYKLFLNGAAVDSGTNISQAPIGRFFNNRPGFETQGLRGEMDEVRIYNRLLSDVEVALLSNASVLTGPWRFSQAAFCPGTAFNSTVTLSPTPATYQWSINGNAISGATSSSFNIASLPATDTLISVNTSSGCAFLRLNRRPNFLPTPSTDPITGPDTICSQSNATFTSIGGFWSVVNAPVPQNPVVRYPFNGTRNKAMSGTGAPLLLNPANIFAQPLGRYVADKHGAAGKAYRFTQSSEGLRSAATNLPQANPVGTWAFWFRNTSNGDKAYLIYNQNGVSISTFYIYRRNGLMGVSNSGDFNQGTRIQFPLPYDTLWHHCVVVKNNTNTTIFIDSVQRATGTIVYSYGGSNPIVNTYRIGTGDNINTAAGAPCDFEIDELLLYPNVLTQSQIGQLFLNSHNGVYQSPVATNNPIIYSPTSSQTLQEIRTNVQGCSSVVTKTVHVNPLPVVNISISGGILTANATGATGFQWFRNDTLMTGATSSTFQPTSSGTYTVRATAASGCENFSPALFFNVAGLEQDERFGNFAVWPNPFEREVKIQASVDMEYQLFNQLGQIVITGKLEAGEQTIATESLKPGSYILRLSTERSTKSITLIK